MLRVCANNVLAHALPIFYRTLSMHKKHNMANICRSLQNKYFFSSNPSPTQIEYISFKKIGRNSHTWALLSKSGLKLVCNVNIVQGNLKSENSQDYS